MPQYFSPGVYVEEVDSGPRPIQGVSTSVAGAVGVTQRGPTDGKPILVTSFNEFQRIFGGFLAPETSVQKQKWEDKNAEVGPWWLFPNAIRGFFDNGGQQLYVKRVVSENAEPSVLKLKKRGIIAAITYDVDQGLSEIRVEHAIGLTGDAIPASQQTIIILNGDTGSLINAGTTKVKKYRIGPTDCTLYLDTKLEKALSVARGDYVQLVAASTTNPDVLNIKANSKGKWGDELKIRVRPTVTDSLTLLPHGDAADDLPASGSLASQSARPSSGSTRTLTLNPTPNHNLADGNAVRIRNRKYTLANGTGAVAEIQSAHATTVPATGIRLRFNGVTMGSPLLPDVSGNVPAAALQSALEGLGSIGPGNVACSAGPLPGTDLTITFANDLGNQSVPLIEDTTGTITFTRSTPGKNPVTFDVTPVMEDDGTDWAPGTPVQKLRISLKDGDPTIYVSGASRLYKHALIEVDNGKNKKSFVVSAVEGEKVTLAANLATIDALVEDDRLYVIEAEVAAEFAPTGVTELFSNLRLHSDDADDPLLITNHLKRRSQLIVAEKVNPTAAISLSLADFPGTEKGTFKNLSDGNNDYDDLSPEDFVGQDLGSGKRTGIKSMEDIEDVSLVIVPGMWARSIVNELTRHCEFMKYRMAILDSPLNADVSEIRTFRSKFDSKRAALYYPWVKTRQPGVVDDIVVPPSGHMAGIYADVDSRRGVHKAPANEIIQGITEIDHDVSRREQDLLNPRGINALRFFPGRGNRVWGARTISSDTNFQYINVRRIFNFIERSIDEGTQFVVFEPNDSQLWSRVRQTINNFLNTQWRAGILEGRVAEEAYFVSCDRGATMTQDDIENGRLICEVGIAPVFPAEFVIFRIQKFTAESKLA